MAWDKPDASTIAFECDSCSEAIECDIETIRAECFTVTDDKSSDFAVCWRHVQGLGWRSFKRTGRNWTYYCVTCIPAAEAAHKQHNIDEATRDRIKAKNST
jgi:hypothetical protein